MNAFTNITTHKTMKILDEDAAMAFSHINEIRRVGEKSAPAPDWEIVQITENDQTITITYPERGNI